MPTPAITLATWRTYGRRPRLDRSGFLEKDRKEWLRRFRPGSYLDHRLEEISFSEFINKELILFSMADNIRSIPSFVDGLKPGQRKVIWACFKRKMKSEIKVGLRCIHCIPFFILNNVF